jgi:glycosyltransferase involved in cell wall biosynthesis
LVPARNAGATLDACLSAIAQQTLAPDSITVFDDGSSDDTAAIAGSHGVELLCHTGLPLGPAEGRNRAAAICDEDFLLFVDADVVLAPTALAHLMIAMAEPGVVAAFGSYDDTPPARRMSSIYANLRHHHVHQTGEREAATFWTGIGIVQRQRFLQLGGFDAVMFPVPSIEDVELGGRIVASGGRILLVPEAQGKHCKDWRLLQLWHSDIVRRAMPWSRLIIAGTASPSPLNLSTRERAKAALAGIAALTVIVSAWLPILLIAAAATAAIYVVMNRRFLSLVRRRAGARAMLAAAALHGCYHLYATVTFVVLRAGSLVGLGNSRDCATHSGSAKGVGQP